MDQCWPRFIIVDNESIMLSVILCLLDDVIGGDYRHGVSPKSHFQNHSFCPWIKAPLLNDLNNCDANNVPRYVH